MVGVFLMSHVHPPLKKVDQHLAPLKDQGTGKVPLGWAVKKRLSNSNIDGNKVI